MFDQRTLLGKQLLLQGRRLPPQSVSQRPLGCPRSLFQPERTHLSIPERPQRSQQPEPRVLLVSC